MAVRQDYTGPALFSYGFRPFFLAALLFALGAIPLWLAIWRGALDLGGPFVPVDWHIHEMIFGYGAAVVTGFLFTAVPNWTGSLPVRGWPLMVLLAVWILGRLAVAGLLGLGPVAVMAVDCLFLVLVVAMIAREIIAGRNWRNLKVLVPVTLLAVANLVFHLEAMSQGVSDVGRRLGLALLVFLVMLIGGRVIPSFTRNWMVKTGRDTLPVPFNRFDALSLGAGALALALWVALPGHVVAAVVLAAAGVLHLLRLARWKGPATLASPLLTMLHLAYLFVPAGLIALALVPLGLAQAVAGEHVLGIGVIGGMTVAVMMRATMGHTGRDLVAGPVLSVAFLLVIGAVLPRLTGDAALPGGLDGLSLAAGLWTLGYALLLIRIGPWLALPKAARKRPSGRPAKA